MCSTAFFRQFVPQHCSLWLCFLLFCAVVLAPLPLAAHDSKGQDFYVSFPPNFHDELFDNKDSLYLYIAAEKPTKGAIAYRNRTGRTYRQSFAIADPANVYTFAVPFQEFELEGMNYSGTIPWLYEQNEETALQSFHITTDEDVTVYGLNQGKKTSDALLVLPTDALGRYYRILSYNSHGSNTSGRIEGYSTPSQFVVVATEDSTEVHIMPSQPTWEGSTTARTIVLHKGQAYLVQASISEKRLTTDLTGTNIVSTKPVAVFAGHQRATIPIELAADLRTRDYLVEQLPPLEAWGYSAALLPYPTPYGDEGAGYDIVRILALYDSTAIFTNGLPTAVINEGIYYEMSLRQAQHITASAPILVAQYKKTARKQGSSEPNTGDPFMVVIAPQEQFLRSYRFVSAQVYKDVPQPPFNQNRVFQEQYISLVAPQSHIHTIRLDGAPVDNAAFQAIPGSPMAYAHIAVEDGVHTVTADTGVGLQVYGYGDADSYGYAGGMNAQIIPKDLEAPLIYASTTCHAVQGNITDSSGYNSGIRSVEAPAHLLNNVVFTTATLAGYPRSTAFAAWLSDPYNDGYFTVITRDSARLQSRQKFIIRGYTVEATIPNSQRRFLRDTTRIRRELCVQATVSNYGSSPQTIARASFVETSRFTWKTPLPIVLAPGQSQSIQFCFTSNEAGIYLDTLVINDSCTQRAVLALAIHAVNDTVQPQATASIDSCAGTLDGIITEQLPSDWGIETIELISTVNCTATIDRSAIPTTATYTATVLNPLEDALLVLRATDEAGNERYVRDTIQGFALHLPAPQHTIAPTPPAVYRIDSIMVRNTSILPLRLADVHCQGNTNFSLPLSQFPLVIPPQQTAPLYIAFQPTGKRTYTDTVLFTHNCLPASIVVQAQEALAEHRVAGRCNVQLVFSNDTSPRSQSVLAPPVPHPADGSTTLRIGVATPTTLALRVYALSGGTVANMVEHIPSAGTYELALDTSSLESGVYLCEVLVGTQRLTQLLHVVH